MRQDFHDILEACVPVLQHYEGFRGQPYDDADGVTITAPEGKLTIGYGRNLQDRPLTKEEAAYLLRNDIGICILEAASVTKVFGNLTLPRKCVLVCMVYQMGRGGVLRFKNFLKNLEATDYTNAALEMLDSKWAKYDSPQRALDMARAMEDGILPKL